MKISNHLTPYSPQVQVHAHPTGIEVLMVVRRGLTSVVFRGTMTSLHTSISSFSKSPPTHLITTRIQPDLIITHNPSHLVLLRPRRTPNKKNDITQEVSLIPIPDQDAEVIFHCVIGDQVHRFISKDRLRIVRNPMEFFPFGSRTFL